MVGGVRGIRTMLAVVCGGGGGWLSSAVVSCVVRASFAGGLEILNSWHQKSSGVAYAWHATRSCNFLQHLIDMYLLLPLSTQYIRVRSCCADTARQMFGLADTKAPLLPPPRRPRPLAQLARTAGVLMREMAADAERRYTAGKPDIANRSRGCLGRDERQPCQLLGQRTLLNALKAIVDAGVASINSLERIFTWITIRETSRTRLGLRTRTSASRTDHSTKDRIFENTRTLSLSTMLRRKTPR